jgi:hypothetical protein
VNSPSNAIGKLILLVAALSCVAGEAPGQSVPSGRDEIPTTRPELDGRRAHAPIPPEVHVRNEGGSDGAGLCVISSVLANGMAVGVPGLDVPGIDEASGRQMPGKGSALWRTAKSRPGGYSPDKLQGLLDEVAPAEKWASYVGRDPAMLERLSRMGYPIGSTMNTGELYHMRPIHHMISLVHFDRDQDLAGVVDNNRPGIYSWMTSREYMRRWIDGGSGWGFVWLRKATASGNPGELAALGLVAAILASLGIHRYRTAADDLPSAESDPYFSGEFADEWPP